MPPVSGENDLTLVELHRMLYAILNSTDNNERRTVEASVVQSLSKPSTLMLLVNVLQDMQGATAGVRQLAAVLLRKKVFSLWQALPMESRAELKSILLTQLGAEPVRVVRFAVAHLVSRIARADALQSGGVWPELQQAIRTAAEDPRVEMRELAMVLAYSIAEVVGECGGLSGLVADAVVRGMADTDVAVLRAALRAVAVLLPFVVERREVRELLLLRVVPQCRALLTQYAAVAGMSSLCVCVLDLLEQLTGELSVRRHEALLRDLAHDVLSVFANVVNQPRVRQNCSELLVTLVNEKPKFVTKVLLEPIITACMRVMGEDGTISLPETAHVEEEEDEGEDGNHNHMNSNSNYDDDDDDDDDTEMLHVSPPCMYAGRLLSTLATKVSANSFTGVLIPLVSQVVKNPQAGPLERKATILSLACLAEGNPGYLRRRVQYVLNLTQDCLQDSNPVPREAAAFSLTYFCAHLQPEILEQHQQLFPMLVPLLHDDVDEVRRRVAGALDTLCENVAEDVEPYVQLVLPAVLDAISRSSLQTQKELCGVISSLAMTRCPSFQVHASYCLELLKGPLMVRTPDTILLRAKVTEAAGIIANAIGKEAFLPYLPFFMERVVENLRTRQAELREESFGFLSNLCETLRDDFMPYLDDSVNCALQTIYEDRTLYENKHLLAEGGIKSFNMKMDNGENNNNDNNNDEEEEEQEIHALVRTADVEEKSSAVYFIGVCAEVLLANFGVNRIDLCWSAMEQLDTHFHNNIRCNTLTTLAKLTKASHGSDTVIKSMTEDTLTPYARGMLNSLLNSTLLPCVYQETDKEVVASACDALELLFNFFGPQTIIEDMDAFVHTVASLLRQGTPCQKTLEDVNEDEGEVGGVNANAGNPDGGVVLGEDHDAVLMDAVCDMLESFAKAYGPSFRPSAEVLLPLLLPYTGEDRPAEDAVMATGCVAVVLAALGPAGGPFVPAAVQLAVRLLAAGDSAVRANAAFLLRTAADHDAWDPAGAAALLQALAPLLQNESQESAAAVDNATSAACSILRRLPRGDTLLHTAVPVLLRHIPMRVDKAENENAICTLVLLLTGEGEFITSQCGGEMLRCIAAVLASRTVEEEQKQILVHQGVAPFLRHCRQQWNEACTQLPLELQNALRQYGCL
ncbi:Importin-beta [Trypanosoma melophagium]|uniref:Importin-beta n=1 Tax=Trypanosoma melophagium TaxID=715481 RepID=UPI003519E519|nr:Importin-beta [Trypanosoma melophagium]